MKMKKYKLTNESISFYGRELYRIEALKDFSNVKKGDKGGFVESEGNLSQHDDCWVYDNAKVFKGAKVYDNARVSGNAKVFNNAKVFENAIVYGNAKVYDDAKIYGFAAVYGNTIVNNKAEVYGNVNIGGEAKIYNGAKVSSISDYIVFKNWWSSGRYFTWTRSNNMWAAGCFYGTGEELIAKAYKDSEISGKEYELVVKYVESILKDGNTTTIVNKIKQRLIKIIKKFNL